MDQHPRFEGKTPKEIYKLVKSGELTREELSSAYSSAFATFDPEEPDHLLLYNTIRIKIEELDFAEREKVKAQSEADKALAIEAGKKYAKENKLPEYLSEQVLIELGTLCLAGVKDGDKITDTDSGEEEVVQLVRRDESEMMLVTPAGEVIAFLDAPVVGVDEREKLLEWVGEKMTEADADIAGLEASKAVWQKKIDSIYDPQINAKKRRRKSLEWVYGPMAEAYLKEITDKTKNSKKPVRSIKVGLLKLAFSKTRESLDVIMDTKAVTWLRKKGLNDAVKVVESVLKNSVPATLRKEINDDPASGMRFNPGGDDKFSMG